MEELVVTNFYTYINDKKDIPYEKKELHVTDGIRGACVACLLPLLCNDPTGRFQQLRSF